MSSSMPESPQPPLGYGQPQNRIAAMYGNVGILCAIIGVFVLPEIFGSAAIILGAYSWRLDCSSRGNRGVFVIIIGSIAMLIGIYYTSFFGLYNILP